VKKQNQKFDIENNQYNSNFIQTAYDEYLLRMNRFSSDASAFMSEIKKNGFPCLPALTAFNTFLTLDTKLNKEIPRWNALNDILTASNVPYNVLEGDKNNFYYKQLEKLIVKKSCTYNLSSLELNQKSITLYQEKKKEFLDYHKVLLVLKKVFNLAINRQWKEAILGMTLINDLLSNHKVSQIA
jgi:hypothetical protein